MKEERCAVCDEPFQRGETRCYSGLVGSNHLLHKHCMAWEEEWVDIEGTNYAPFVLAQYRNRLNH